MEKERLTDELGSEKVDQLSNIADQDEKTDTVVSLNGKPTDEESPQSNSDQAQESSPKEDEGNAVNGKAHTPPTISKDQDIEETPEEEPKAEKSDDQPASEGVVTSEETKQEEQEVDYSSYSKQELLDVLLELVKSDDFSQIGKVLKEIRPLFDAYVNKEKDDAYQRYLADGGEKDGFEYHYDEVTQKFNANYNLLWDRRQKHFKNLEKQKDDNYKTKTELLEKLRVIADSEESGTSIKEVKEIQESWKAVGPVPRQHNRTLWANYNALLDRFYDHRSIYYELKELDRKKNLEAKKELCEKAEALVTEENINKAVQELNHLHEEFKHIGPIPKEVQEEIWLRFKAASDTIYSQRREHVDDLKEKQLENLEEKTALCEKVEAFLAFQSDKISEWNEKTKELLEIQKSWEKVGSLPRDRSKAVNKRFWSAFKGFFNNKGKFFKSLEGEREENLKRKEELVGKAEGLKDSTDFNKTAEDFKELQRQWKEIGPVPDKVRNDVYKRFKLACDEFFNNKRAAVKESEKEFVENLQRKQGVCDQLEEIAKSDKIDLDMVEALQTQFSSIGFVPRSDMKSINQRYAEVVDRLLEAVNGSDLADKDQVALEIEIRKMKGKPGAGKSIHKQENQLRKQISTIENDISTWKNNLEFFRDSKTADQLRKDFDVKIDEANAELKRLRKQLKMMAS